MAQNFSAPMGLTQSKSDFAEEDSGCKRVLSEISKDKKWKKRILGFQIYKLASNAETLEGGFPLEAWVTFVMLFSHTQTELRAIS